MPASTSIETYDVVVVGGGAAGLAAAIEARGLGRDVALIEKNPELGGSTAWSIGSITSSATPHQIHRGIKDSPDEHFADMPGFNGDLNARDNRALARILCDEMPATFRWLLDHGIRFFGPMPEPPHRQPRMHNVLPNSRAYIHHLERAARKAGVSILPGLRATGIVREEGRVVGVRVGESRVLRCRGGIILAAGDFTNSPELKRRYMGETEAKVEAVNPTATGDGQILAMEVGGRILNGDLALGPEIRFVPPMRPNLVRLLPPWTVLGIVMQWAMAHAPAILLRPFVMGFLTTALAPSLALFEKGAILINRSGRRFCLESDRPAYALPDQPDGAAYILLDRRLADMFSVWPHYISTAPGIAYAYLPDYRASRPDIYTEAKTLDDLSRRLGIDAKTLKATVNDCNAGRVNSDMPLLAEPPFTALGPVRAVFVHNEGGLAVDACHRVLDASDRPIPGLYAAGSTGQGGLLLKGHGHHLAWAFVSGRRAGCFAAFAATSPSAP